MRRIIISFSLIFAIGRKRFWGRYYFLFFLTATLFRFHFNLFHSFFFLILFLEGIFYYINTWYHKTVKFNFNNSLNQDTDEFLILFVETKFLSKSEFNCIILQSCQGSH